MVQEQEEVISQDFEAQIPEEEEAGLLSRLRAKLKEIFSDKKKKNVFIGIGVLTILLLIIIVVQSTYRISLLKTPVLPSPTPSPFEEEIASPSAYATDSAVLDVEKRLKEIEKEIDQTDLKETGLNPPVLDMEVNFEE